MLLSSALQGVGDSFWKDEVRRFKIFFNDNFLYTICLAVNPETTHAIQYLKLA